MNQDESNAFRAGDKYVVMGGVDRHVIQWSDAIRPGSVVTVREIGGSTVDPDGDVRVLDQNGDNAWIDPKYLSSIDALESAELLPTDADSGREHVNRVVLRDVTLEWPVGADLDAYVVGGHALRLEWRPSSMEAAVMSMRAGEERIRTRVEPVLVDYGLAWGQVWDRAMGPRDTLARDDVQADAFGPEPTPESDGTIDPSSGRETGAQRLKVGDRVWWREAHEHTGHVIVLGETDPKFDLDVCVRWDRDGMTGWHQPEHLEVVPAAETGAQRAGDGEDVPPTPTDRAAAPEQALHTLSAWIDAGNAHRDPEAVTWGRIAKIAEEHGEVVRAYIGATGQNPRKGITGGMDAVEGELLDVAVTALGAVAHLHGNDPSKVDALGMLGEKITAVATRAGLIEPVADVRGGADAREPITELPTTPGSVAWTRNGSIWALTADEDDKPWRRLTGGAGYKPGAHLVALGVVKTFDSATGIVRTYDSGECSTTDAGASALEQARREAADLWRRVAGLLAAKVARVEALLEGVDTSHCHDPANCSACWAVKVRRALTGSDDAEDGAPQHEQDRVEVGDQVRVSPHAETVLGGPVFFGLTEVVGQIVDCDSYGNFLVEEEHGTRQYVAPGYLTPLDGNGEVSDLPLHRTEAGYPHCSTCDGGGCPDCTDPA